MEAKQLRIPWNKGKLIGQKAPLKLQEIYAIRTRLQLAQETRELAMFDLAIDSKLRACDLVNLCVQCRPAPQVGAGSTAIKCAAPSLPA